jgi:HAD superfamily hydrolase (TIGR01549 family)
MALKCVIFDVDGTLTATSRLIFESFNHIAERYKHRRYTDEEIIKMFGPPEEVALLSIVGKDQIDEAMEEYLRYYRGHHAALAYLHPGMEAILEFIKSRNCKLAVFTGKGTQTTRISLQELGIESYFDYIVTGNDVVNHKPSSEGLAKILKHFSLVPEEALMIGDAVSDIHAAHEAGIKVGVVLWDSYAGDRVRSMPTDYSFRTVKDLEQWLKENLDARV